MSRPGAPLSPDECETFCELWIANDWRFSWE